MKIFAVVLAVLLVGYAHASVQVLTNANFDDIINKNDISLVKFYAPWCSHCQTLAPEFEKAADLLGDKAVLAEVDCTKEEELAKRFNIEGYPTLIAFQKGQELEKYEAPRDASSIAAYLQAISGPLMNYVADEDDIPIVGSTPVCIIKTASKDSDLVKIMTDLAAKKRTQFFFYVISGASEESVTVNRGNGESEVFEGEMSTEALAKFLPRASVGFLDAVSRSNIAQFNELSSGPIGWLFLDLQSRQHMLKAITPIAKKYRKDIVMLWVDTTLYGEVGKQLALSPDVTYPAFVLDKAKEHHVQPTAVTAESLETFIKQFLEGSTSPTLRSELVPAEETKDGLTTLVGKTIGKYLDSGKNIFILFYAPWCGHCKSLHPIYDELAKSLAADDTVIIAKIDATSNDFDRHRFTINGFPTLYMVPAGGESDIPYEGPRTLEAFTAFVKKHAVKSTDSSEEDL